MVKRVVMFVILVAIGLVAITHIILPQVIVALNIPSLATWTGLGGFLKILPFVLVAGLLYAGISSLWHRGKDD